MESTGSFWKPLWNLLEGQCELLLVNTRHLKLVPGRKRDVKDAEWIADLLRHGLLQASFVPEPEREFSCVWCLSVWVAAALHILWRCFLRAAS
jgi:hypothetical protein